MTKLPVKRKWTFETLYTEAQKYKTIKEFKEKSHSAYVTAVSSGFVKQICFYMYTGKRKAKLIMEREQAFKYSSTNNPQPPQK